MPDLSSSPRSLTILGVASILAAALQGQGISPPFDAPVLVGDDLTHFRSVLDYDDDGWVDAMSTAFSQTTMTVRGFRNDGAGHLAADWVVSYPHGQNYPLIKCFGAVADFNADGRDDFVHTVNEFFGVWISNGAGVVPTIIWGAGEPGVIDEIVAADFDDDGRPDFALRQGLVLRVWLMQPSGIPVLASSAVTGPGTMASMFLVDADGDGDRDLGTFSASFGATSQVWLYVLSGGVLQPPAVYTIAPDFLATAVAGDVDGDGDEDITLFGGLQNVTLRRAGPSSFAVETPVSGGSRSTGFVDLDDDGDPDAVSIDVTNGGLGNQQAFFSIAFNDGTGAFGQKLFFNCSRADYFAAPERIAGSADLDHDGDQDLVAGNCVYYGRGSSTEPSFGVAAYGPRDLIDLDGDGDPDALPGFGGGFVPPPQLAIGPSMRANRGDGSFGQPVFFAPPAPVGLTWDGPGFPGDFDGDGDVDLLVDPVAPPYAGSAFSTHFLANLGCGVFVDQGTTMPGIGNSTTTMIPNVAFNSDLDGDGDLDLVVSPIGPTARSWLNQGNGTFVQGPTFVNPVIQVADLNGDGHPDLLAAPSGQLTIVWGPVITSPTTLVLGSEVNTGTAADFDGDGDLDIFAVGSLARLYTNQGAGIFAAPISFPELTPQGPNQQSPAMRVLAADVDADGLVDLVSWSPVGLSNGAAILRHDGPGGAFGPAVKLVFQPIALADLDGDGDPDAAQPIWASARFGGGNLRFQKPASGARLQYGAGTAGSGGIVPIIGETGPFREGVACTIRITGGLGAAGGLLGIGVAPDNSQLYGVTLLMVPAFTIPIQLGGTPGAPGTGSFVLPFTMPPGLGGVSFYKQAGFADPAGPAGFSATNGLRIDVGF